MTRAELIAALQRHEPLTDELRAEIADYIEPPKRGPGQPRQDVEEKLAKARNFIERVETLTASLGKRHLAYRALATDRRTPKSTGEMYQQAKRLVRIFDEWTDAMVELTEVIKNITDNNHPD